MSTQTDFLQTLAPDGVLTPEQAAQLLELPEGDTSKLLDNVDAPASSTATETNTEVEQGSKNEPATPQEPDAANAVILAKDGKHTIPYDKLVEAREGEKHWKAQAEAAAQELAALKAQAEQRAAAGQAETETDRNVEAAQAAINAGVNPDIFGDFSEEALAKGIQTLVAAQVEARVKAAMESTLKPIQDKQALDATQAHYQAIYEAHPDADSIAESKELADWIKAQPSFARAGFEQALTKGTTEQIIELFDTFKKATGASQPAVNTDPKADPKAAARAAIAKAGDDVPNSLTDIPGGKAGATSLQETIDQLSPHDLLDRFANMTPAQIERLL
jgi:hypothetical protein